MTAPTVTYRDGVAIITTTTRRTEVHVEATASMILDGVPIRPSRSDLLAMAAGYQALAAENKRLADELAAARAGTIGREHAAAMQAARKALAELNKAAVDFMEEYDKGEGPDGAELVRAMGNAEHWLICDVKDATRRGVLLAKGGAT